MVDNHDVPLYPLSVPLYLFHCAPLSPTLSSMPIQTDRLQAVKLIKMYLGFMNVMVKQDIC